MEKEVKQNILRKIGIFLIKLLVGLGVFGTASLLISHFFRFSRSDTFTVIGVLLISCGLFSVVGGMNMTADAKYYQAASVSDSLGKKVLQEFKARDKSLGFLLYMALLGGILVGIGYLIAMI